ncbi:MAG: YeeE/YedE thiosulfate transporter family protein [Burkholderiales bacterium]|nr:YeeE/YedE thiosulfate transporter family protein [Burkholderiales bacterium]
MGAVLGGLLTGLAFGFILHRGGLTRYSRIMGTLLLRDLKPMKFMFTAVAVAALGMGLAELAGWSALAPRVNAYFGPAHFAGGALFGVGMALGGF